jgi:hypothetical protein
MASLHDYGLSPPGQAVWTLWSGPKYLNYNSIAARLRAFITWPRGMNPSPDSLSSTGFYYTGKNMISWLFSLSLFLLLRFTGHLRYIHELTGVGDRTICLHCGSVLEHWLPTDVAWAEHSYGFPFCVFLRYIKRAAYIHECRRLRSIKGTRRKCKFVTCWKYTGFILFTLPFFFSLSPEIKKMLTMNCITDSFISTFTISCTTIKNNTSLT